MALESARIRRVRMRDALMSKHAGAPIPSALILGLFRGWTADIRTTPRGAAGHMVLTMGGAPVAGATDQGLWTISTGVTLEMCALKGGIVLRQAFAVPARNHCTGLPTDIAMTVIQMWTW